MAGDKKESRLARWSRSLFEGRSRSRSEGRTSGVSSLAANTAPGSAISLPPGSSSSKPDTTSLAQNNAHNSHASGASAESIGTDMQNSQVSQSSGYTAVGGKGTENCPEIRISTGEQEISSKPHAVGEVLGQVSELVDKPQSRGKGKSVDHSPAEGPGSLIPATGPKASKFPPSTDLQAAKIHDTIVAINKNLEGQQCGERMRRIVGSLEECAKIIDVAIQHHPDIVALVWAGARFILMVVANKYQFMENLQATMSTVVEKIATCEFYAGIYQQRHPIIMTSTTTTPGVDNDLDADLNNLYAAVRAFLDKAMDYLEGGKTGTGKISNLFKPFSVSMEPLIENIREKEEILKKYAWMATMETIKELPTSIRKVDEGVGQIKNNLVKLDEIRTMLSTMVERFSALDMTEELRKFTLIGPQPREIISSSSFDSELQKLKCNDLSEFEALRIFQADLYVTARGMSSPHAPENAYFDLVGRLKEFLSPNSPHKVCLIQGVAGSGKSTFNHFLATRLWEEYDQAITASGDATPPIPIFVTLARLHDPTCHNQDLIGSLFKRHNWPEETIWKAKQQLQFVFILDGYDEIENQQGNFYDCNGLKSWQAKIVITSRPEYLGRGYQWKFHPEGQPELLQEYWLAPFSVDDIHDYTRKYVEMVNSSGSEAARSVDDYKKLVENPGVQALVSNPFLLKLVMTVQRTGDDNDFKRVTLYRRFLDQWLSAAHKRLSAVVQVPQNKKETLYGLWDQDFVAQARVFCLSFAMELYRHKVLEASYSPSSKYGPKTRWLTPEVEAAQEVWGRFLDTGDSSQEFLRRSSPLLRVGQAYRFLHKSLRDFAVAQCMLQDEPLSAPDSLLNEFHIVEDHGIIDFIVEEAKQNQELQAQLLECVEESKQNPKVANAAANAITILVRAGKRFHKYDLRGIRIPGADLRTGWFDGAQLQGADLRRVRWNSIWLRGADLTGACIDGGECGEKPYFRLEDSNKPITCFYTPDGELLVAAGHSGTHEITLWSVTTRRILHTFRGHTDVVTCVAFPPNGDDDLLASVSWDRTVRLWSRQSQDVPLVHMFNRHTDWVHSVAFPPNGDDDLFASASRDRTVRLWSSRGHVPFIRMINRDTDWVHSVAFSPDAKFLASGGGDSLVCLWSVATHNLIHSFSYSDCIYSVAFSPDGQTLAAAGRDQLVRLWSTKNGELLQTLRGHTSTVNSITFAPDGQILVSASNDKSLKLWSVLDGKLIHGFTGHAGEIHTVAFSPDGQMIATATEDLDAMVRIWSVASRKLVHVFEGIWLSKNGGSGLAFSRDSELIATGSTDGIIRQWSVPHAVSDSLRFGGSHTTMVNDLAFSYDKKLLASASSDGTVRLWSMDPPHMPTLVNILAPSPARELVLAVTFTPASAFLITSFAGPGVHLYRSPHDKTRSSPDVLGTHKNLVWALAMSPNGDTLASASRDSHIGLWSIQSGTKLATLEGHRGEVYSVDFSPDGQLLISGSSDQTATLWSVPSHGISHIYEGHTDRVSHVAFSPDGETIASASFDKTVRLWSVPDRKSVHSFKGHTSSVTRVAFSPDGYLLASGSSDKTIRLWSLSPREPGINIDIQSEVYALAWTGGTVMGGLLAIGTRSGGVQLLQVIHKRGYSRENPVVELSWFWASDHGASLNVFGVQIEGVTGLNPTNIELLKQRGAIGEPIMGRVEAVEEGYGLWCEVQSSLFSLYGVQVLWLFMLIVFCASLMLVLM